MTDSDRRVALVTGAGRGIGRRIALGLAADGWSLGLVGRTREPLERTADEVGTGSSPAGEISVAVATADVAELSAVQAAVASVSGALGRPRLLVNNAAVIERDEVPIWEADPLEWRQVVEVDLLGVFHLVRVVVPLMLQDASPNDPARVVTLSTGSALKDSPIYSAYSAAKTGAARITGALHLAGADRGLLAFDVSPGVVRTEMTAGMRVHDDRTDWTDPSAVVELVTAAARGELDSWSGHHLRAGLDTPTGLIEQARRRPPAADERALRLTPWGEDDPILG